MRESGVRLEKRGERRGRVHARVRTGVSDSPLVRYSELRERKRERLTAFRTCVDLAPNAERGVLAFEE